MTRIAPIIVGLLMILSNAFWAYFYASIWYNQEYLKLLVFFYFSPIIVYLNMLASIFGMTLGVVVFRKKVKITDALIINIGSFILLYIITLFIL